MLGQLVCKLWESCLLLAHCRTLKLCMALMVQNPSSYLASGLPTGPSLTPALSCNTFLFLSTKRKLPTALTQQLQEELQRRALLSFLFSGIWPCLRSQKQQSPCYNLIPYSSPHLPPSWKPNLRLYREGFRVPVGIYFCCLPAHGLFPIFLEQFSPANGQNPSIWGPSSESMPSLQFTNVPLHTKWLHPVPVRNIESRMHRIPCT